MNKKIKKVLLLTAMHVIAISKILALDAQKQEPLILKIMNNSKHAAVLSEIEYSYAFTVNNKTQKHVIPNTTAIQFSPHQAKQLAINVSIPIPSTTPSGASIEFNPMGITGIKMHSKKSSSDNKKITINPPYYHLNVANAEAPSICINYNTKEGWHIESCKKVKPAKKTPQKASKKTKKSTTSTTATASGIPAMPKENSTTTVKAQTAAKAKSSPSAPFAKKSTATKQAISTSAPTATAPKA